MKFLDYVLQDARLIYGDNSLFLCIARYFFSVSFRITIKYKVLQYFNRKKIFKFLSKLLLRLYYNETDKLGCCLDPNTEIGAGLRFHHNFPVVIHYSAKIGENRIIHPGTQIGTSRTKVGAPVIGNNCFLGNGCHIIGNCTIGDWCFISPCAFVCKDIPTGSVVGFGINNIISSKGREVVGLYSSNHK